jgi:hypothetical protein
MALRAIAVRLPLALIRAGTVADDERVGPHNRKRLVIRIHCHQLLDAPGGSKPPRTALARKDSGTVMFSVLPTV